MNTLHTATLDELANKYQTDKGTAYQGQSRHGYANFYDELLSKWRTDDIRMLEVGICMEGTVGGHSVYMWREYFEFAKIYTFDIVDMSNHDAIINSKDVFFFRGDQGNREDFTAMYNSFGKEQFDFVLEDGSHTNEHQMISFAKLFEYVKPGGLYFLEDISIPGNPVCCIRNDKTHEVLTHFIATGNFESEHINEDEKEYLESNIDRVELFTDVQNAYMTAAIFKKL